MQSRMQIFLHLIGFPKKANAKSLDRKTLSLADQGLSAAPHFLKTIYFDFTLAKTEIIYPKNVRAKVAMDFT